PARAQAPAADHATPQTAQTQRSRRDSSPPQAEPGRSAARSAQAVQIAARASTKAAAKARSQHRSHPPKRPAATACNRRIAPQAAQNQAHCRARAPHSRAIGPAPADPTTSRPQRCDAAAKAQRARPRQAQTHAPATAPRAKDQNQPATLPSAHHKAPLRSPHQPKPEPAPLQQPKPPAAPPQAARGRSCAGSRGAQQHPQAQLPALPHPTRQRDHVPPARPLQPLQKPQPALPIRQRHLARTLNRSQRRTRRSRIPQPINQPSHRRRLEQAADRNLNIKARTDAADQTRRQQRMAPKRKKVILNPNTLQSQHLGKQRAQQLLSRIARQTNNPSPNLRRRQRRAVKLPVRRQRQALQYNDR